MAACYCGSGQRQKDLSTAPCMKKTSNSALEVWAPDLMGQGARVR